MGVSAGVRTSGFENSTPVLIAPPGVQFIQPVQQNQGPPLILSELGLGIDRVTGSKPSGAVFVVYGWSTAGSRGTINWISSIPHLWDCSGASVGIGS